MYRHKLTIKTVHAPAKLIINPTNWIVNTELSVTATNKADTISEKVTSHCNKFEFSAKVCRKAKFPKMLNASFDLLNDSVFDQDSDDDKIPTGPSTFTIVNCILNVPLLVLSILGNTMVLTAVLKTPSLRSPSIILLCGLAASDFVVGLIVQPIFIARDLTSVYIFARLTRSFGTIFCGISFATMSAISVDRFLAYSFT